MSGNVEKTSVTVGPEELEALHRLRSYPDEPLRKVIARLIAEHNAATRPTDEVHREGPPASRQE